MSNSPVTVLGLGAMGKALATAFVTNGHPTTVWNRTPEKAAPLVALGAMRADDVAGAAAAGELVVVCLLDYDSVYQALAPATDALKGRTLVNLTNGTPRQAREMAGWAAAHGISYLDGGIMAIPPGIGTDQAFVLYSGPGGVFEAHRPALERLGAAHFAGEDPGLAALYDIALLSGMYGLFSGVLHALALVNSQEGASVTGFAPMLGEWIGAMAGSIPHHARQIESGDYTQGVVSGIGMQAAAFDNLLHTAEDQGIRPVLFTALRDLMKRRVADGHGAEDISGLVELLRG
ncbi:NAD(P)-dependent oxidoreductase [Streptomyces sp. NPDC052396]|uniref:NAD(P)-dependent oxidoreductase n=1 Tax=Streptomyces sp. NPDC052396 TaxID=3365689 RepID=UPI0037D170DE